jgi:hypothetical protein
MTMKKLTLLALLAATVSTAAFAHHSRAAFKLDKTIQLVGVMTEVSWTNPHLYYKAQVANDRGGIEEWILEGGNVSGAVRSGWQKDSVKVGDHVVIEAYANRKPEVKYALLERVTITTTGATFPPRERPTPAPVTPSTDFTGTWVLTGRDNRVGEHFGAPKDLTQLTELGKKQIAAFDTANDPYFRCIMISTPRVIFGAAGYRFTRDARTIKIDKEHSSRHREIHMDGAPMPAGFKPDMDGWSVGHMEPDGTLVVETSGFAPTPWGVARGVDSSAQKRSVERYKLDPGGVGITASYTITDPVYLTAPYTVTGRYRKVADYEFPVEPPCDPEIASRHLRSGK